MNATLKSLRPIFLLSGLVTDPLHGLLSLIKITSEVMHSKNKIPEHRREEGSANRNFQGRVSACLRSYQDPFQSAAPPTTSGNRLGLLPSFSLNRKNMWPWGKHDLFP